MKWYCKAFNELSNIELYQILQARAAVFVVEQTCVYQDVDGKDEVCYHVFAKDNEKIVAYARLLPAGISYPEVSFGRVLITHDYRNQGLAHVLIAKSMDCISKIWGCVPIQIGAQEYLSTFYQGFGFAAVSAGYLEDGIAHIDMLRTI